MDFSGFQEPSFNLKQWVNETLKSAVENHNVEQEVAEVSVKLQTEMDNVVQNLNHTCLETAHSMPRMLREVETLKMDASALRTELQQVHADVKQMDTGSRTAVIAKLAELDQTRRNTEAAANTLREADRWTLLAQNIEELVEACDVEQICRNLEEMERCLTALTHLPDYAERVNLVKRQKNTLESLAAPQLMKLLDQHARAPSVESRLALGWRRPKLEPNSSGSRGGDLTSGLCDPTVGPIGLLTRCGRREAAVRYYHTWLQTEVTGLWREWVAAGVSGISRLTVLQTVGDYFLKPLLGHLWEEDQLQHHQHPGGGEKSGLERQSVLVGFYIGLLHLFEHQLTLPLFPEDSHPQVVVSGFTAAMNSLRDEQSAFLSDPEAETVSASAQYRLLVHLLRIVITCASLFGKALNTYYPALQSSSSPHADETEAGGGSGKAVGLVACNRLFSVLLLPQFESLGKRFDQFRRPLFDAQLAKINTEAETQTEMIDVLMTTILQSMTLVKQSIDSCFRDTYGLALPHLLTMIQNYWDSLIAKWRVAITQFGERLTKSSASLSFSQAGPFTCALQLANLTGELSMQADFLVENLLTKSVDLFSCILNKSVAERHSPLLCSDQLDLLCLGSNSLTACDLALLHRLVASQPEDCRQALHVIAYPSSEKAQKEQSRAKGPSKGIGAQQLETSLTSLHRSNVVACQAAVNMMRQVALAPLNFFLRPVAQLPVWNALSPSGEPTLPDLAYMPQDYITQIGQYLLAFPDHLEPYLTPDIHHSRSSLDHTAESLCSTRGLAECLHLGDPEAVSLILAKSGPEATAISEPSGGNADQKAARCRLPSTQGGRRQQEHEEELKPLSTEVESATFCWLESLVSSAACDLIVSELMRIGGLAGGKTSSAERKKQQRQMKRKANSTVAVNGSDTEEADDGSVALTEHGAKQLKVDLDYFNHLLEDLGVAPSGSLQAFCELLTCPADQFPVVSADRPPAIVHSVSRLRGLD